MTQERRATEDDLFRKEALEEFATSRAHGRLLRISPTWSSWVFWLLLFTLVSGFAFIAFVPVGQYATGVAGITSHEGVTALFPSSDRGGLEVGQQLVLIPREGTGTIACRIAAVDPAILGPEQVRTRMGTSAERILSAWSALDRASPPRAGQDGVVLVHASILAPVPDVPVGLVGRAEVRVGDETLLRTFAPGGGR